LCLAAQRGEIDAISTYHSVPDLLRWCDHFQKEGK
jgi:hypothetical protein